MKRKLFSIIIPAYLCGRKLAGDKTALGFKLNLGRNDFFSSGQIPLDEVFAGRLDRFGFIDLQVLRVGDSGICAGSAD